MYNNLKVLHLFNSYLPKTEIWAYQLIRHLPDVEIHIGANNYLRHNYYNSDFHFIDNPLSSLARKDFVIDQSLSYRFLRKALLKIAHPVFGLSKRRISKYVRDHQIELIHAHFADIGCAHIPLIKALKIPFFVSFYGWDYERLPFTKPVYKKYYQELFNIADQIICEGENGKNTLVKMGCPPEKLTVNHLGVAVSQIPFKVKTKKENQLSIIQIASFMQKKGHIYTVAAFKKALTSAPNMQLCLVGVAQENEIKDKLIEAIKNTPLEKNIVIIPGIDYNQIHDFLSDYDVFIQPSCYSDLMDCEGGAPIAILDAQSIGMPIISTNHCDIPEEVVDKKTGILVPEKTIDELSEAILTFYRMHPSEYKTYSQNARKHVVENYEITKNAANLKAHYDRIIAKRNNS